MAGRFDHWEAAAFGLPAEVREALLTPALIVFIDHVRANLRRVIHHLDGDPDRWRPHVKTVKVPEVFAEIARTGVRAFKCATTREAARLLRTLDEEGTRGGDVLFAHHAYGPALARLAELAHRHPGSRVSVLCEHADHVDAIPASLSLFADVNSGMNRTGIAPERVADVAAIATRAGKRFRGVHYYDGHLHIADSARRRLEAFACYDRLMTLLDGFASAGVVGGEVITSGTPSFLDAMAYPPFAALEGTKHRVSPGTVVYHDLRTEEEIRELDLIPAALVLARVVSRPAPDLVTLDAGSKAIAADAGDPCARVVGYPGLVAEKPSEEHVPLRVAEGPAPERGETVLLVPRHVCPTVNLAEEALLVEDGRVRGVVPVGARAHDHQSDCPSAVPSEGST